MKKWECDETDIMYSRGFIPSTLYFLVNKKGRFLGAIHLRHTLDEKLLIHGGHIGYGVRPTERGNGYASVMLSMLLERIKGKGYQSVLVTCDETTLHQRKQSKKTAGCLKARQCLKENLQEVTGLRSTD